jgi:pyrroloquinoline quinone biosynthesis protein B
MRGFIPVAGSDRLSCRAIVLPGRATPFEKKGQAAGHSVAYQFLDRRTGGRLLVAPDVAGINSKLQEALDESDAVIFDGTFWSSDELAKVKRGAVNAARMGHVTIKDVSLGVLAKARAKHKVYIHINNTNPMLARHSPERSAVEAAGIAIGHDGYSFKL